MQFPRVEHDNQHYTRGRRNGSSPAFTAFWESSAWPLHRYLRNQARVCQLKEPDWLPSQAAKGGKKENTHFSTHKFAALQKEQPSCSCFVADHGMFKQLSFSLPSNKSHQQFAASGSSKQEMSNVTCNYIFPSPRSLCCRVFCSSTFRAPTCVRPQLREALHACI